MAKLRRKVIITTVRWEDTEELTEDQVKRWKSEDSDLQDEVHDEVVDDFDLVRDKVLEDTEWPELIEE
tara:strand:- start:772 stop:975 length:204 start_codon:yes stop_codon:yes gene_type:complete